MLKNNLISYDSKKTFFRLFEIENGLTGRLFEISSNLNFNHPNL